MHMHVNYISFMRTTIDLPPSIRQKLVSEAARRNSNGYSEIIVEALEQYFRTNADMRDDLISSLKGSMSGAVSNECDTERERYCSTDLGVGTMRFTTIFLRISIVSTRGLSTSVHSGD